MRQNLNARPHSTVFRVNATEPLQLASTHWLRHTHGTLGVKAGIDLPTMKDGLGHDDLGTTGIYVTPELIERKRQMDKLFSSDAL